jgi:dihydrofolate synthase/folylpolyglutamate synthase
LGDNRELIGYEKAGIMRANHTVIIGDIMPPLSVLEYAKKIKANAIIREQHFYIQPSINEKNKQGATWQYCCVMGQELQSIKPQIFSNLINPFIPLDNVATALTVLSQLDIELNVLKINRWIEQTKVVGRMESFTYNGVNIMLDVAHNPQAARHLSTQLQLRGYNKIYAVVAMMSDKDINSALVPLADIIDEWYLGDLNITRAASVKQIANTLSQLNQSYNCFDNVTDAFKMACANSNENDLVLVFGSFFTVAAIRPLLLS